MSKEAVFVGVPQDFKNKFLIFPPKVKEIVGNKKFGQYRQILVFSQEELEDEYLKNNEKNKEKIPTPLEFLLTNSYHNKEFEQLAKEAFYFFTKQEISFLYEEKLILIGEIEDELKRSKSLENLIFLNEEEYFEFQNKIRVNIGEDAIELPDPTEHPRIKQMKAKARYRDKIKAKQGGGINLLTSLASICCMSSGINPLNIGEMSYASINTLISTYQKKEKYDIDIASLQAGADSKKIKPKYWITN